MLHVYDSCLLKLEPRPHIYRPKMRPNQTNLVNFLKIFPFLPSFSPSCLRSVSPSLLFSALDILLSLTFLVPVSPNLPFLHPSFLSFFSSLIVFFLCWLQWKQCNHFIMVWMWNSSHTVFAFLAPPTGQSIECIVLVCFWPAWWSYQMPSTVKYCLISGPGCKIKDLHQNIIFCHWMVMTSRWRYRLRAVLLTGQVWLQAPLAHELSYDVDRFSPGHHGQQLDELGVVEALQRLDLLHKLVLLRVLWRPTQNTDMRPWRWPQPLNVLRPGASTLFERLDGHLPVLRRPVGLPHLAEVPLPQLLQQAELLPGTLPRLHVEELPLHTQQGARAVNQSANQSVIKSVSRQLTPSVSCGGLYNPGQLWIIC